MDNAEEPASNFKGALATLDQIMDPSVSGPLSVPKNLGRQAINFQEMPKDSHFQKKFQLGGDVLGEKKDKSLMGESLLMESNLLSEHASQNVSGGKS